MPKRSLEKAIQGGLSLGAFGALQGNRLRKMYGNKGTGVGAAIGAVAGATSGYLSGVPDASLSDDMYDDVKATVRQSTMRNARKAADVAAEGSANVYGRRNIGGPATEGIEAALRGKILSEANQSLIPFESQIEMAKGQDRLNAERAEEYELRQGWQDAALATGQAARQIVGSMAEDHAEMTAKQKAEYDAKMAKVLPTAFGTWNPQQQIGWMTQRGIPVPQNWAEMSPQDKMSYLQGYGMNTMGPGADPDPQPWKTQGFPHFKPAYTPEEEAQFNAEQYGVIPPVSADWEAQKDAADRGGSVQVTAPPAKRQPPTAVPPPWEFLPDKKPPTAVPPPWEFLPDKKPPIGSSPGSAHATQVWEGQIQEHRPVRMPPTESEGKRPPRSVIPGGDTDPNVSSETPQWMKDWSPENPAAPEMQGTGLPSVVPGDNMPIGAQPRWENAQSMIWDEKTLSRMSTEELRGLENDVRNRLTANRDAPLGEGPDPQRLQRQLELIQKVRGQKFAPVSTLPTDFDGQKILKRHEDLRLTPYWDGDKIAVGYGRNLTTNPLRPEEREYLGLGPNERIRQLTPDQAEWLYQNDFRRSEASANKLLGETYTNLDPVRQSVVTNMIYNLGEQGFSEFTDMISALQREDYDAAADAMKDSDWYEQVGVRSPELVNMMRSGSSGKDQATNTMPTVLHDALPQDVKDQIQATAHTPPTPAEMKEFQENMPQTYTAVMHPSSPLAGFATEPYVFQILQQAFAQLGDDTKVAAMIQRMHQLV